MQIDNQIQGLGYFVGVSSIAIYGGGDGSSWDNQKKALVHGADIIVATPGRFIAHLNQEYVKLNTVKHFILDEADRMLDMGFYDDIKLIMKQLPANRQNLMFSATMPANIKKLTNDVLKNPEQISLALSKPAENIVQAAFLTYEGQKAELLKHLLKAKKMTSVIVFSSKKASVDQLTREFKKMGIQAEAIHSGLEQQHREKVLQDFTNRQIHVLVATDVVSSTTIYFTSPDGVAFTFINEEDMGRFSRIEKLIEKEVRKVKLPSHIGEGPVYNPNYKEKKPFRGKKREKR